MRPNTVKQKWQQGKASVGSWLTTGSPLAAEMMAHVGFDWLTVDMEHNAIDLAQLQSLFHAITTTPTIPMVRVPWNDPQILKRVLDLGAYGVVVPDIKTAEEAELAVDATRYPPLGSRGIGSRRGQLYGGPDYFDKANEEIALILMIEDIGAVGRIDEIMSVKGFDAVFIGPNDLASSMGIPLGLDNPHPDHLAAVRRVLEAGKRHNIPVGIHCGTVQVVNQRIQEGFLWLALSSDGDIMHRAAREAFSQLKLP